MKHGLVLEGGGMRGMFTNGVIDVLMENNITFDALVGVSAGVLFGCNYKSQQPGRALRYNIRYKNDKRYMSWYSLLTTGDFVNKEFSYHTLPWELDPFDRKTFQENPMKFYATCTDIITGESVYQLLEEANEETMDWFRASASMPMFARPVKIGERILLDGGLSDSIPLKFTQSKGYEQNVVVLTQPKGYRKEPTKGIWLIKMFTRKYPKVAELLKHRHEMYNKEIDYLENEEKKGNTLLLYPEKKLNIGRIELDEKKMRNIYAQGREVATQHLEEIKNFINTKE